MGMRNFRRQYFSLTLVLVGFAVGASAQKDRNATLLNAEQKGWEYEIRAGFNIGGTSPLPLPEEIRSIDGYTPPLSIIIEGNITHWFGQQKKWGVISGLRLENKGMTTKATVKNYGMEIIGDDGNSISGMWTGGVRTKVSNEYLTIPVLAAYKLSPRWKLKGGLYFSYLIDGEFSGTVYEGYMRVTDPTGQKVEFADGAVATYYFSDDLRKFAWGLELGADWRAFNHLDVFADLTWGLNDIFKSSFETVTFALYPIYLTVGFGYAF